MKIKAESRKETGKKIAKKLRKQGKIPAIIYGEKKDSIPITIPLETLKEIFKTEKGENTVLKIHRDDIEVDAMLKEVQYDYLSENIIHADFLRIDLNKPVLVWVPIETKGEPIGVKMEDGVFDFVTRDIQVKCLATKIPQKFELDVSELHAGHSIKAEDLEIEEGVKLISDSQRVICAVTAKAKASEAGITEEEEELETEEETPETEQEETSE